MIYRYQGGDCNATYTGNTTRCLSIHFTKHEGVSNRTLSLLHNPPYSAIKTHSHLENHHIQDVNFKILNTEMEPDLHT